MPRARRRVGDPPNCEDAAFSMGLRFHFFRRGAAGAPFHQSSIWISLEGVCNRGSRVSLPAVHLAGWGWYRPEADRLGSWSAVVSRLSASLRDKREQEPTQVCDLMRSGSSRTTASPGRCPRARLLKSGNPRPGRRMCTFQRGGRYSVVKELRRNRGARTSHSSRRNRTSRTAAQRRNQRARRRVPPSCVTPRGHAFRAWSRISPNPRECADTLARQRRADFQHVHRKRLGVEVIRQEASGITANLLRRSARRATREPSRAPLPESRGP